VKQFATRLIGYILIVGAILGLILSIAGLITVPTVEQQATDRALAGLDLLDRALLATAEGLSIADEALQDASDIAASLQTTTLGASQAVSDTIPLVNSVAALAGKDLPNSITAAQQALGAAESSAKVIDDTLSVLATLARLGGVEYQPSVPLHTSIAQVSDSLDSFSTSFSGMENGLITSAENLAHIESDITKMADSIGQIDANLTSTQSLIGQYQDVVADLQAESATIRERLPKWLQLLKWGAWLTLIWLAIAQLGLLSQGLEMIRRSQANKQAPSRTKSVDKGGL
jgi:hypothetical protein